MTDTVLGGVFPDFGATTGGLGEVVGALVVVVLVVAVLMLLVCAVVWAIATSSGNHHTAGKAKTGLLVALGTAVLAGCAATWMNFLIGLGNAV